MSIYGAGYRTLEYQSTSMRQRLWPIAWQEYTVLFKRRFGVVLFVVCLGPSLFNLGVMLLQMGVMRIGAGQDQMAELRGINPRMDAASIEFFLTPMTEPPSFLVFIILTAVVSCRTIAKDRESRALEIYWTRCITSAGYFLAKWFGSFLLVGTVVVAAPAINWVLASLLAPDWSYLQDTVSTVPRVLLAQAVFTAVLTLIATMFSAVAATANLASILWFSLLVGTAAVGRVLARVFPGEWWFKAVNPWDATKRVAEWICGYTPNQNYDVGYALAILGGVGVVLGIWTVRRMRQVEAVAA